MYTHIILRFYIGCERCSDWFHGRCVGILQSEAERIDEYLCPNCDPNSHLNAPNMKELTEQDYEMLKKVSKQMLVSGMSKSNSASKLTFCFSLYTFRHTATVGHLNTRWTGTKHQTTIESSRSLWVSINVADGSLVIFNQSTFLSS